MMAKKIALIGFDRRTGERFERAGFDVVAHVYANPENKSATYPDHPEWINFHNWKRYLFESTPTHTSPTSLREKIKQVCFQDFIRCTERWDWSRELVHDWGDYNHLFAIACDWANNWLAQHKPDALVFSNVPHQGLALVAFHAARELGIETRVFIQSQFGGRSWLLEHWQDFGRFETSTAGDGFDIETSAPARPPFYMSKVRGKGQRIIRTIGHNLRARTIVGLGLTGITQEQRKRSFHRNLGRWRKAALNEAYLRAADQHFTDSPADEPYVYFPLHLQPEMTTDVLGGIYADQLLALEALRSIVPSEIPIYVKENPKQSGLLRGDLFFTRLGSIENLKLLAGNVPSFDLIEGSVAVATITGTVGWEALRMGKPAICFGHCFWNRLPGVSNFSPDLKWEDIANFSFDASRLKSAVDQLSRHSHPGICDQVYAAQVSDFDAEGNGDQLANTLMTKGGL